MSFNSLTRVNSTTGIQAFTEAPDSIYGTGADATHTLDGTTAVLGMTPSSNVYTMTRDIFFDNLTINAGVRLAPNGYRIFVKNILTFSGNNASIGFTSGFSTAGSIQQGGAGAVSHSLGGSATGNSAIAPTAELGGTRYWQVPRQAVQGYSITASGGPTFLRGGAGASGQTGGGVIILAARYITGPASGSGSIAAPATAPAGGGVILLVSSAAALPASVTTNVTGQNPGTVNYMQLV